jgi:hypothetical protein
MALAAHVVVPVRSLIAALIARFAPEYYKQIIEQRHPGVLIVEDAASDVRVLKDQGLHHVMQALEAVNLQVLAKIDDRNCWVVLASSGEDPNDQERLILKLVDYGLRVSVAIEGRRRTKRVASRQRLENLKRKGPLRIIAIRAGMVWMRARGYRQVGWHAAARIHLYDWDDAKATYRARKAGSLPPMIDKPKAGISTIPGLSTADTRLDKTRFPIDVVYTWVDGNDIVWNERRRARAAEVGRRLHKAANSQTRYINRDELCYSLRSLYYYAPWIRRIFLVTDDQVPAWYDASSSILKIVSHRELFPDSRSLPTFNSHAIESVLHRIPGLSEQFIYMNDDVFFSSIVHPESFFEVSGIARTFLSRAMIPFCGENRSDIASEWGAINANQLLYEACGAMMPYKTKHTPIPLSRTLLESLESRFPQHFERLRRTPFRTRNDLAPTTTLHAYFGMTEGKVVRGDIAYRYLNLARPDLEEALQAVAYDSRAMVYCLNDTEIENHDEFDWSQQERIVTDFLKMMYPYQAPWERADRNAGGVPVSLNVAEKNVKPMPISRDPAPDAAGRTATKSTQTHRSFLYSFQLDAAKEKAAASLPEKILPKFQRAIQYNATSSLLPDAGKPFPGGAEKAGRWWALWPMEKRLRIKGTVRADCMRVGLFVNDRLVKLVNTVPRHDDPLQRRSFRFNMKADILRVLPRKAFVGVGSEVGYLQHRDGGLTYKDPRLTGNGALFKLLATTHFLTKKGKLQRRLDQDENWKVAALSAYTQFREYFEDRFGHKPFIICGTLLGYYREGDFIAHDDDVDVAYFSSCTSPEQVKEELKGIVFDMISDGYDIKLARKPGFFKPRVNGFWFDVFPMWFDRDCLWMMNTTRQRAGPDMILPVERATFRGVEVYVPRDVERYIEGEYGPNWRVPDPGYRSVGEWGTSEYLSGSCMRDEEVKNLYLKVKELAAERSGVGRLSIADRDIDSLM